MELKEIQAIDCSLQPHYVNPQLSKDHFKFTEMQTMAKTTFAGVFKKMGLKPGEEWKVAAGFCKNSIEEMLAEMDEVGVEKVVMIAQKMWSQRDFGLIVHYAPELVAENMKKAKGRIVGAASYNPFRIPESLQEIEKAVKEYGFKYVWFHPISFGMRPDDRRCYPLFSKCLELGIPVGMQVGHSAETLTSEPGHPMNVDNVAIDFPDLKIILTHTGYPWIDEWCSMIWRHPNVYGMLNAYFPSSYEPATIKFINSPRGRDKVVSGSHGFGIARWKKEFMELPISDEAKKRILRDNALKIFNL